MFQEDTYSRNHTNRSKKAMNKSQLMLALVFGQEIGEETDFYSECTRCNQNVFYITMFCFLKFINMRAFHMRVVHKVSLLRNLLPLYHYSEEGCRGHARNLCCFLVAKLLSFYKIYVEGVDIVCPL